MVERFEPIVAGREIGNAFSELTDAADQRPASRTRPQSAPPATTKPCESTRTTSVPSSTACRPPADSASASTALVMLLTDAPNIRDVMAFPTLRPEATQP